MAAGHCPPPGCYFDGDRSWRAAGTRWHPVVPPFGLIKCAICTCKVWLPILLWCHDPAWAAESGRAFLERKAWPSASCGRARAELGEDSASARCPGPRDPSMSLTLQLGAGLTAATHTELYCEDLSAGALSKRRWKEREEACRVLPFFLTPLT